MKRLPGRPNSMEEIEIRLIGWKSIVRTDYSGIVYVIPKFKRSTLIETYELKYQPNRYTQPEYESDAVRIIELRNLREMKMQEIKDKIRYEFVDYAASLHGCWWYYK